MNRKVNGPKRNSVDYTLHWDGWLTLQNNEQVADLIRQLLDGNRFTFVEINAAKPLLPVVRTSQVIHRTQRGDPAITSWCYKSLRKAGITVFATNGWYCETTVLEDEDGMFTPIAGQPYFIFDGDSVTIEHMRGRNRFIWCVAIEKPCVHEDQTLSVPVLVYV